MYLLVLMSIAIKKRPTPNYRNYASILCEKNTTKKNIKCENNNVCKRDHLINISACTEDVLIQFKCLKLYIS